VLTADTATQAHGIETGNICERCINRIPTWKLKKLKASSSRVSG
jgi:hypothetical protein